MSIQNWPGGVISKTPPTPSGPYQTSTAPGVWTLKQATDYIKQGNWPTAGNFANWVLTLTGSSAPLSTLVVDSSGAFYSCGTTAGSPNTDGLLVKFSSAGVVSAKKTVTGSDYEMLKVAGVNSSGDIFLFGYNIPSGAGQGQALVMRLNSSYGVTWQKKFEYSSYANDEGAALGGIDSSGNVYFNSDFYNGGARYGMQFKLDSSGAVTWARQFGGRDTSPRYCCVDSSGNQYLNILDWYNPGSGIYRQVTMKIDSSGTLSWNRTIYRGSENVQPGEGQSIAVDSSGNVYVVGRAKLSGYNSVFVAKYNSSGTLQWAREIYSTTLALALEGISVDPSGNVYAVGKDDTNNRILVFKYDSSGALQWQRYLAYSGASLASRGTYADSSFVYVCGFASSAITGAVVIKLLNDGSGTGTFGSWTYDAASFTDTASGLTDAAGPYSLSTLSAYSTSNTSLTIGDKTLTETLTGF